MTVTRTAPENEICDAALVADALFLDLTERTASYSDVRFRLVSIRKQSGNCTIVANKKRTRSITYKPECAMEHRHRARLLIADDHTLLAEACKGFLEPEFDVVASLITGGLWSNWRLNSSRMWWSSIFRCRN